MIEGEWEVIQDGEKYLLTPGYVLFLPAGHHHYGHIPCKSGTRTMFIHFSMHPDDILGQAASSKYHIPVQTHANCGNNRRVCQGFERIISTYWSTLNEKEYRISALVDLLLAEVSSASMKKESRTSDMVRDVQKMICMKPNLNITPEMLAEQTKVSVRSIRYYFKKETGISLHQYQLQTKLDMAFQQLQIDNQQTLYSIASGYGFYDEFHFSRLFKKRFGISPSQVVGRYQSLKNTAALTNSADI
jgi:AraC-like DNA-binding protein